MIKMKLFKKKVIVKRKIVAIVQGIIFVKQYRHGHEFVFLVQMFFKLLVISLCFVKLTVLEPKCEETSVSMSMLSSLI